MIKLFTEIFPVLFLFIIFCQNIDQVNTLRCAHSCPFGPISLGSSDPIKNPCNTIDINTDITVCSVFITINFETSYIHGTISEKRRSEDKSEILHLSSILGPYKTLTFINYYCTTTDDCDQNFVRETVSTSKWFQLNETKVRTDITSLLFQTNSSSDKLICANDLNCSSNENCYAQLFQNSSASQTNPIAINNKFPCENTSPSQITFEQNFKSPGKNQDMTMNIYCNKDECNQQNTVEQIYNILRDGFTLPLNYSAYIPIPNGSHRIKDFITIRVFLFFICIHYLYC
jgi:hypothetical protein